MKDNYAKFGAMIGVSTIVMFGLMYLNTSALDHVYFSETRAYMALVMGATMAIIMLAFMLGMYTKRAINAAIFIGSVVILRGCALARPQSGDGRRRFLDESHDPASLDRHPDE